MYFDRTRAWILCGALLLPALLPVPGHGAGLSPKVQTVGRFLGKGARLVSRLSNWGLAAYLLLNIRDTPIRAIPLPVKYHLLKPGFDALPDGERLFRWRNDDLYYVFYELNEKDLHTFAVEFPYVQRELDIIQPDTFILRSWACLILRYRYGDKSMDRELGVPGGDPGEIERDFQKAESTGVLEKIRADAPWIVSGQMVSPSGKLLDLSPDRPYRVHPDSSDVE